MQSVHLEPLGTLRVFILSSLHTCFFLFLVSSFQPSISYSLPDSQSPYLPPTCDTSASQVTKKDTAGAHPPFLPAVTYAGHILWLTVCLSQTPPSFACSRVLQFPLAGEPAPSHRQRMQYTRTALCWSILNAPLISDHRPLQAINHV